MSEEDDTTHIRVTTDLKDELEDCDGHNFTERIRNYAGKHESVNNGLTRSDLEEVIGNEMLTRSELEQVFVNNGLTSGDAEQAVRNVLSGSSVDKRSGDIIID